MSSIHWLDRAPAPSAGAPRRAHRGALPLGLAVIAVLALPGSAAALRFMPTGDSITEGVGSVTGLGFRPPLHSALNAIGNFDFVGSPLCVNGDPPYEGYYFGGERIGAFLPGGARDLGLVMPSAQPEMLAIHLGTNDVNSFPGPYGPWSGDHSTPNSNATGRLGGLVQYALSFPGVDRVVVSRITPIIGRESDIESFNREVVRMVLDYRNGAVTGSPEPVFLADHYRRFLSNPNVYSEWMDDDLHPNADGYDEMSDVYFRAVDEAVNDAVPPAAPSDLAVGTIHGDSILLLWTNTGDDGHAGDPAYADCRYATGPITAVNFRNQSQSGDYAAPGPGGSLGATRITGLSANTLYTFALKLMDDAANLSPLSNLINSVTAVDDDTYQDRFNRPFADPGPDWDTDEFQVAGDTFTNTGGGFATAIFRPVVNATRCEFVWAATADAPGIGQAGFACRMDGTEPTTADGYIAYRNTGAGQGLSLREILDGQPGPLLDTSNSALPAPQAGDRMTVVLTTDPAGHHFAIHINDELDGVLDDPLKRHGNGNYFCGFMSDGALNNDIDDWQIQTQTVNLPPVTFNLTAPADGELLPNLNPHYDWNSTSDPNGDEITYELHLSTDADFPPAETEITDDIQASDFATGVPLAANRTYYWKVRAVDSGELGTFSNQTRSFMTDDFQQIEDDFERPSLGPDWAADPSYSIQQGELDGTAPLFGDLAVYRAVQNPVAVEWTWSESASQSGIGGAGALIGMDAPSTSADGYFVFRNTSGQRRWSVFEVVNGELTGSLGIDRSGLNPIPVAGDRIRVVFVPTPTANYFHCFINDRFDAEMTDSNQVQGNGPVTYAGLLLGLDDENNAENFVVMGRDLNLPPAAFSLVSPLDNSIVYSLTPVVQWTEAVDPNPGDPVAYTVAFDQDPNFGSPEFVQPTTQLATAITGTLVPETIYYWQVTAEDASGAQVVSDDTWRFTVAPVTAVTDDFNRPDLGSNWNGDTAVMRIVADELKNTSATSSFDLAVYVPRPNPDAVQFRWSPAVILDGIQRGGMALRMTGTTGTASGYWVTIDPYLNRSRLEEIRIGGIGPTVLWADGQTPPPAPGSTWRVVLTSDDGGHHFDVFVNGIFHSRLSDPEKRQGNAPTLYAGVALRGQVQNQVDDFMLLTLGGLPPSAFNLISPAPHAIDVPAQPTFLWSTARPPGILYLVYVNTSASFPGADSALALADTTLTWASSLPINTDHWWRVRATDGQNAAFNTGGWSRFRTTATPVELESFTAIGEPGQVVLAWQTSRELRHLGFRVWRVDGPEEKRKLVSGEVPLPGPGPYRYVDPTAPAGSSVDYWLEAVARDGSREFYGPRSATARVPALPFALHGNVPNPFNPSTTFAYDLPRRGQVALDIFDSVGRRVRRIAGGWQEAGPHHAPWDGRDDQGRAAPGGVYFARLTAEGESRTRKLVLLR